MAHQPHDGLNARVNFTPTVKLENLSYSELFAYTSSLCTAGGIVEAAVRNHRCEAGRAFSELFRRWELAKERGEDVPKWDDVCTSLGVCRKTVYNLRMGYAAVLAADALLLQAVDERKIDVFQPQVNKRLVAINLRLGGRDVTPAELPALLNKLDPPEKPPSDKKEDNSAGSADNSANTATGLDPDKTLWAPIPQTVEEVDELRTALVRFADKKAIASDPLLFAFVAAQSRPPEDVIRALGRGIVELYPELSMDDLVCWMQQGASHREPQSVAASLAQALESRNRSSVSIEERP